MTLRVAFLVAQVDLLTLTLAQLEHVVCTGVPPGFR